MTTTPILSGLHLGDCLELMRRIPDASVDMVLCDLPYGTTRCRWDAIIPFEPLWVEYRRVARPDAAIVLTAAQPFSSVLVSSNIEEFRYDWIWEKPAASGHFNAKKIPLRAHEHVLVFYRRPPLYNPQMTSGHARKQTSRKVNRPGAYGAGTAETAYDSTDRYPRSVQRISTDKQRSALHPTQKPVALFEYLIRTYTQPGELVLDNCIGSGTTAIAALNTNRRWIGMESDPEFFRIASDRIRSHENEE